jgi:hypothetical protein
MPCYVPEEFKGERFHVIKPRYGSGFEVAEWVNNRANGPEEGGHWLRWGYCGDFPSLCHADYIGPVAPILQHSLVVRDVRST